MEWNFQNIDTTVYNIIRQPEMKSERNSIKAMQYAPQQRIGILCLNFINNVNSKILECGNMGIYRLSS